MMRVIYYNMKYLQMQVQKTSNTQFIKIIIFIQIYINYIYINIIIIVILLKIIISKINISKKTSICNALHLCMNFKVDYVCIDVKMARFRR